MISWYHLLWIVPLSLLAGGQLTSIFEYFKHYNLTDEEIDLLKSLAAQAKSTGSNVLGSIKKAL